MIGNRKWNPYALDVTELDVSRFVGSPSYDLAVVVHRETEARRKLDAQAFRAEHGNVPTPTVAQRGLLGGPGPYDSSQSRHWGEYAKDFDVLVRCREALGVPIGDLAKRIALELGPDNAETFFWMGAWLQTLDQKSDIELQLQEQKDKIERSKTERSKKAAVAAHVMHEAMNKAKAFVLAEWALHKDAYEGNRTEFARHYVGRIKNELDISVSHKTIAVNWLGKL